MYIKFQMNENEYIIQGYKPRSCKWGLTSNVNRERKGNTNLKYVMMPLKEFINKKGYRCPLKDREDYNCWPNIQTCLKNYPSACITQKSTIYGSIGVYKAHYNHTLSDL